ncbi:hypothetical protein PRZ48_006736 [Zasmidium cellare]|uniref:Major facilitator superfamily (MFS) profile domain-containing protein n=1 Tax=Zasmidium cellare TaxID=395010 RepID=A0ABR0EQC2_ZASCE|nr:hypothetical protein PRZ48_006736 [Zasmidium cellare]
MLTDAAGSSNIGKALGSAGSFITAGVLTGPVVSGALLQFFTYWLAWAPPLALLGLCFVARFAMLEETSTAKSKQPTGEHGTTDETGPLISDDSRNAGQAVNGDEEPKASPARGFYSVMFSTGSTKGQAAFVATIIALGIIWSFVRGATMHELKEKDPNVFGPGGASSRVFSLTETSFALGLVLGPIITGYLADFAGFYWATTALGEPLSCVGGLQLTVFN